jgi:hypothetical protein
MPEMPKALASIVTAITTLAVTACGGGGGASGRSGAERLAQVERAARAILREFPSAQGLTLQQVADRLDPGPAVALATENYTPGRNRFAFGLIDAQNRFVYAPSAVYVGKSAGAKARGPFRVVADSLITDPPFRSRQQATEDDRFASIYSTQILLEQPGKWEVVVATKLGGQLLGGTAVVRVVPEERDPVPSVGERAPVVETDTVASASGNIESIETRVPPDDMHEVSFSDVVGRKPVALLFATPALCQSRVCGPVVDIAAQLQGKYGDRVEFIHQETFVDNDADKGFRPPLRRFGLHTEPWLFTTDRTGRIAARLEGSFGLGAFERALSAALR